jgi:DNA excision repair protein ERCC-2
VEPELHPRGNLTLVVGTMSEIEKALAELKALMKYREEQLGHKEDFRGLGLTSRKNLCLHPSVKREKSGAVVDARCRSLTAGFVKEKKERGEDVPVCIYHDVRQIPYLSINWLTAAELGSPGTP